MKKIAIIIPHFNGIEIIKECLESLRKSEFKEFQSYVVDNGSSDDSKKFIRSNFPEVKVFALEHNLGYSGGCNYGYEHCEEEFVLFLNNDTIHEADWLTHLYERMCKNTNVAAIQPKIRSYYDREKFDYSGAAGGEIDKYAYPFARGRIFDTIEEDKGQYDKTNKSVFWASGTAILLRRKALEQCGVLDDEFFAHMEEIDLCWRLRLFAWDVEVETKSIIYHHSAYTLGAMSYKKMYLNHRNNLLMMYKNLADSEKTRILLIRYFLEGVFLIKSLFIMDLTRVKAIFFAMKDYFKIRHRFYEKRIFIQSNRQNSKLMRYNKSIVLDYFIRQKKKYSEL